jgi:hypothetical protein
LVAAEGSEIAALHGEAVDATAFPANRWPNPAVGTYQDATVTDGDADWSLRR